MIAFSRSAALVGALTLGLGQASALAADTQQPPPPTAPAAAAPTPAPATPAPAPAPAPAAPAPALVAPAPATAEAAPLPSAALTNDGSAEPPSASPRKSASVKATALPPDRSPGPDTGVEEIEIDDGTLGTHQVHFYGMLGARTIFVADSGYDPFSGNDIFAQGSLGVGRVLYADGPWSVALGLGWDYGARGSDIRGAETTLRVHRLTVAPEVRYHLFRRLFAFGRLGLGTAIIDASLEDDVGDTERETEQVTFTADAGAGLAFELVGRKSGTSRESRFWVVADGGAVWTPSTDLVLSSRAGLPERSASIDLGSLSLAGPYLRVSLALTF